MSRRDQDGRYRIEFTDGTNREVWGRPSDGHGVLHIVKYIGGASMPEIEESRVSFSLANVKSWEKVGPY